MKLNMYIVYLPAVLLLINIPQRNENTDSFKTLPLGPKSGLRVKSTCSGRVLRSDNHTEAHSHLIIPVPGNPTPPSDLCRQQAHM